MEAKAGVITYPRGAQDDEYWEHQDKFMPHQPYARGDHRNYWHVPVLTEQSLHNQMPVRPQIDHMWQSERRFPEVISTSPANRRREYAVNFDQLRPKMESYPSTHSTHQNLMNHSFSCEAQEIYSYKQNVRQLRLPVIIPQVAAGLGKPFTRAYTPELAYCSVSEAQLIEFIDRLNIVATQNPAFGVLNITGGVLGNVPHHWAVLAGQGMKMAAMAGTAAVSKGRTNSFLQESNEVFFRPRGLMVSICAADAVRRTLGLASHARLLVPLEDGVPIEQQKSVKERQMKSFAGVAAEIRETKLPAAAQDNVINKLCAKQVGKDVQKMEKKMLKDREKELKKGEKKRRSIMGEKRVTKLMPKRRRRQSFCIW